MAFEQLSLTDHSNGRRYLVINGSNRRQFTTKDQADQNSYNDGNTVNKIINGNYISNRNYRSNLTDEQNFKFR